jgi:F-type H+-transporting ATPase subunit delta
MPEAETIPNRVASVMEDPSALAVARVYADAYLDAAGGDVDGALEEFTSFLDDVLKAYPDFEAVLLSGFFTRDEKVRLIDAVVGKFGTEIFTSFLRVLARHERLELLPLILKECWLQHEIRQGKRRVQVRSAIELPAETLEKIRRELNGKLPFEPIVVPAVDPSLIGGIVIQVGDTIYDDSLRNRMKQLRTRLRERSVHEIQRGRQRFAHE